METNMNKQLCEEYENLCFYERWYTHKSRDDIEHFSYHALLARRDHIWYNMMTNEEHQYIEDKRQANFDLNMFMIEMDR
jgi:hypothetical protein